ncbi:condensin subunit ScpB [Arboricoccus pini]|uniref:Condensin subunit ScpB n=1 Tax=Arboricoccus pini TaxID=1963835 RepID=A0A212QQ65_9PROT|nr:SMC-Scp complex subunit ScpB [Arboricoccus pini]SNB61538.1 condensin subunit ScpB [Arboricoccus pini]
MSAIHLVETEAAGEPAKVDAKAIVEALLFASPEPLSEREIQAQLGALGDALTLLHSLRADYVGRGIRLEGREGRWAFRTAPELAPHLTRVLRPKRRLSKAAMETLSIIAYRQPVTRAEIEAIRGVAISAGTLDLLVDTGWVTPKGRRDAPGRPVTWVTTPGFLDHFDLQSLSDLPRLEELEGAGLFNPPAEPSA